jgi:hypothetical protein
MDGNDARVRAHQGNIARYRRLLRTQLTELERDYIERRLAEERLALGDPQVSKGSGARFERAQSSAVA